MTKKLKWGIGLGALVAAGATYSYFHPGYCRSAKTAYGLELPRCPEGKVVQVAVVSAEGVSRTKGGTVRVSARAIYTAGKSDEERTATLGNFEVELALVKADGTETELIPEALKEKDRAKGKKGAWRWNGTDRTARISLPAVDDGDYKLRARVKSRVGESTVDVPIGLYAPAKIHVLTDRPLYEPGNVVQFRALALRAADLSPIDRRPGTWIVLDPNDEVLLEERVAASEWGVIAGDFPLDKGATHGEWSVHWRTGSDVGERTFTVEPFTLPRFRIETKTEQPFYGRSEKPRLTGSVVYSSGAPVVGAAIDVSWRSEGAWPPPPAWIATELPKTLEVAANGKFDVELPQVPSDLRGQTTLVAILSATDPAGDRVAGVARILLSEEPIKVDALTELESGLVQGSNNRVYLRVTTADGRPLPGMKINVKRGWQPGDPGIDAVLDADAVGRVQVDPGPPVNIVVPPMPVRPQLGRFGPVVTRTAARDLVAQKDASLADRRAMDSWTTSVASCARWATGAVRATVGLRVSPAGKVTSAVASDSDISRCVANALAKRVLPAGNSRLYSVAYNFVDPKLPVLQVRTSATLSSNAEIQQLFQRAATDARSCVALGSPTQFADAIAWRLTGKQKKPTASWIRASTGPSMSSPLKKCILAAISRLELKEPAKASDLGVVRFTVRFAPESRPVQAQPTIMKGYELKVTAALGDDKSGVATLRMTPGAIPNIRMRATPVVAQPGQEVAIAVLRGPNFNGKLPKKIRVRHLDKVDVIDLDEKKRTAQFKVPADAKGWYIFDGVHGSTTRVFIKSQQALAVDVSAEQPAYRPGETATLKLSTTIGGQGATAAVGLFGVDSSLGQLTTLAGPDEFASLRPPIEMAHGPALGVLDAQALTVGRVQGENAAEATVLRVTRVPEPEDLDSTVSASASSAFDPIATLTDRFYPVLAELHRQTREWERTASASDEITNKRFAQMWKTAMAAVKASGGEITDAYGRELRLHRLPTDLLALTEPRQVVISGTRLPEDFENWANWVQKEKP